MPVMMPGPLELRHRMATMSVAKLKTRPRAAEPIAVARSANLLWAFTEGRKVASLFRRPWVGLPGLLNDDMIEYLNVEI